jgi:hypothetical protein
MKLIWRNDTKISRAALLMALSFLCIQYTTGKLLMPLLLAAVLGVLLGPLDELLPCLLVILSWFYLWIIVFEPTGRNRYRVGFALGCLFVAAAFPLWLYLDRPALHREAWAWYWVPTIIFSFSTYQFIHWFYFATHQSNSEISTE